MKTDVTRPTFDPSKRYSSVRLQQGRMQLDADWNEAAEIALAREQRTVEDIVGPSGGPAGGAGFALAANAAGLSPEDAARPENQPVPALGAGDVLLTAGRYYVQGALIENPRITTFLTQPDLPGGDPIVTDGVHLAYLDVWEHPVTSLEDPGLREVALGGPDTATRTKRIWQMRTVQVGDPGDSVACTDAFAAYDDATASPTGQLAARAEPDEAATGPCIVPESAGYRSLENQLYRVEVHRGGTRATARFKFSRENGSVVVSWLGRVGDELSVATTGPDRLLGFATGDWVELIDQGRELRGEPGTIVRLIDVRDAVLVIDPATADGPTAFGAFVDLPRIRRWDGAGVFAAGGAGWSELEQGVQVRFSTGDFRVADYWLIPARTAIADVEWPRDGGQPALQRPRGIAHRYGRLGLIEVAGGVVSGISDCRPLFPPLTGLVQIDYVGGDGQEAMPDLANPAAGVDLAQPLQVAVSNGTAPREGAQVEFTVTGGGGGVNGGASAIVETGADGVAAAAWRLGVPDEDQTVEARLLDHGGVPQHLPVRFSATFSTAARTAYRPGACATLAEARTVQEALDILCQAGGGAEPGFTIQRMVWRSSGSAYRHDGVITTNDLQRGLEIFCDADIAAFARRERPSICIDLFAPFVLSGDPGPQLVGSTLAHRLTAELAVRGSQVLWQPVQPGIGQIARLVDDWIADNGRPVLCELTVRGDTIRAVDPAPDGSPRFLDAEAFERPGGDILPTGNRRRGGTFKSWFWVGDQAPPPEPRFGFVDVVRRFDGTLSARLIDRPSGAGVSEIEVRLLDAAGAQINAVRTQRDGTFAFREVPIEIASPILSAEVEGIDIQYIVNEQLTFDRSDFLIASIRDVPDISDRMRLRLERVGFAAPEDVANTRPADLIRALDISETTAIRVIAAARAAAVRA